VAAAVLRFEGPAVGDLDVAPRSVTQLELPGSPIELGVARHRGPAGYQVPAGPLALRPVPMSRPHALFPVLLGDVHAGRGLPGARGLEGAQLVLEGLDLLAEVGLGGRGGAGLVLRAGAGEGPLPSWPFMPRIMKIMLSGQAARNSSGSAATSHPGLRVAGVARVSAARVPRW
jgi:hypothetical protein